MFGSIKKRRLLHQLRNMQVGFFGQPRGYMNDCKRHIESASHKQYAESSSGASIGSFLVRDPSSAGGDTTLDDVTKAEATVCGLCVANNLSLSTAPKLVEAIQSMCPDSKIAKSMKLGRCKATAMIKEMSREEEDVIRSQMSRPFTVSTDGSNDSGTGSKQFPLVIRSISKDTGLVESQLLALPICKESATGENISSLVKAETAKSQVPWTNCISLGCDNAPVMTGRRRGVYAFLKQEHDEIFLSGCSLHMVHNATRKGMKHLPDIGPALTDIFYFFEKSSDRQHRFEVTQRLHDEDTRKILKHTDTRWLSIGKALE